MLGKTENFDELMAASAEERDAVDGEEQSWNLKEVCLLVSGGQFLMPWYWLRHLGFLHIVGVLSYLGHARMVI